MIAAGTGLDMATSTSDAAMVSTLTFATWSKQMAAALCRYAVLCCNAHDASLLNVDTSSQSNCEMSYQSMALKNCADEYANMKITFNADNAQRCLSAVQALGVTCGTSAGAALYTDCIGTMPVLASNRMPGDICDPVYTCSPWPYGYGPDGSCAAGFCGPHGAFGDPPPQCVAYAPMNGACDGLLKQCDPAEQFCDGSNCRNYVPVGGDCTRFRNALPFSGGCDPSKAYPLPDSMWTTCACLPMIPNGMPCDARFPPTQLGTLDATCMSGYCETTSRTCKAQIANGMPCDPDPLEMAQSCESYFCDPTSKLCAAGPTICAGR
jgi:hypothetical protein